MSAAGDGKVTNTPEHVWPVKRLRFLMQQDISDKRRKVLADATQVTFLPMENIGERGEIDCSITRDIEDVRSGYTQFFDGDVLVAKITPCFENGKGALVRGTLSGVGFGTTELHVLAPTNEIDARFLYYVTASDNFRDLGEASMFGAAGQKRVPEDFVRDYRVPIPNLARQRAIVAYLDHETVRLDALVAAKERILELLVEKRQALITCTIGGIIPEMVMYECDTSSKDKDRTTASRSDKMTFNLNVQLRYVFSMVSGATPDTGNQEYWDGDILWITPEDLSKKNSSYVTDTRRKITRAGYDSSGVTIVPSHSIALSKRAPIGHLGILQSPAGSNQGCFLLTSKYETDARYFYYYLSSIVRYLQALGSGSTFTELGANDLKSIRIPNPPLHQQCAIADQLDRETAQLDELAFRVRESIVLLKERRAALISAAVTGQIDMEDIS